MLHIPLDNRIQGETRHSCLLRPPDRVGEILPWTMAKTYKDGWWMYDASTVYLRRNIWIDLDAIENGNGAYSSPFNTLEPVISDPGLLNCSALDDRPINVFVKGNMTLDSECFSGAFSTPILLRPWPGTSSPIIIHENVSNTGNSLLNDGIILYDWNIIFRLTQDIPKEPVTKTVWTLSNLRASGFPKLIKCRIAVDYEETCTDMLSASGFWETEPPYLFRFTPGAIACANCSISINIRRSMDIRNATMDGTGVHTQIFRYFSQVTEIDLGKLQVYGSLHLDINIAQSVHVDRGRDKYGPIDDGCLPRSMATIVLPNQQYAFADNLYPGNISGAVNITCHAESDAGTLSFSEACVYYYNFPRQHIDITTDLQAAKTAFAKNDFSS